MNPTEILDALREFTSRDRVAFLELSHRNGYHRRHLKLMRPICTTLLVAILALATASAELNRNDDFEGSVLSTNSWQHLLRGVGLITQTNQHLIYQTAGAPTQVEDMVTVAEKAYRLRR